MSAKTTLLSLAMLKTKINRGQDYLAYLEPFVCHIIQTLGNKPFVENDIVKSMIEEFGLKIPMRTIQILINRIVKGTKAIIRKNKEYFLIGTLPPDRLVETRADARRRISTVIRMFVDFANQRHQIKLSEDVAFDAIAKFLSKFSIDCIRSYLQGTVLPEEKPSELQEVNLVCSYVRFLHETDPDRFNDFMIFVEGQMLANALLCPDLKGASKDYQHVTFYFDTPLLIQAIGLDGDEPQAAAKELIDALQNLEGHVAYFAHTAREVKSVIRAAAENLDSDYGHGSVTYEARRKKWGKADLLLFETTFEEKLARMNIQRRETPTHTRSYQIDERAFGTILSEVVRYANGRTKEYDVESVRCVYELRKGDYCNSLEQCKAVLVTSNTAFAKAADKFGKTRDQQLEVSAVISSISLMNLAWLKSPMEAPSLPKKEVLSYSYAALRPDEEFLKTVLAVSEELEKSGSISVRDHKLLRSEYRIQEKVAEETLGDAKKVSPESIKGMLEQIKSEIKKEEADLLTEERRRTKVLTERLEAIHTKEERLRYKLKRNADRFAMMVSIIIGFLFLLALAFAAEVGVSEWYGKLAGKATAVVVLILGILSLLDGRNVKSYVGLLKSQIGNWKYRRMLESLSLPEQEQGTDN